MTRAAPVGEIKGEKEDAFMLMRFPLFVLGVQILPEKLVHGEHMNLILLEYSSHCVVTTDHAFVVGVLQAVLADICPYPFHSLRA